MAHFLWILIALPMVGGFLPLLAARHSAGLARFHALSIAVLTLATSVVLMVLVWQADKSLSIARDSHTQSTIDPLLRWKPDWFQVAIPTGRGDSQINLHCELGADGLGSSMCVLTALITLGVMLVATRQIEYLAAWHFALLLWTEGAMLGVFLAMDLISFYVFFEATLLPLFLLIGLWGGSQSWVAARQFLIFTIAGSIPLVVALLGYAAAHSSAGEFTISIPELSQAMSLRVTELGMFAESPSQQWIFWLVVFGFGIKMAILPVHTWLPGTYLAAHPTTAALLAAVVVKLGIFGFFRVGLPLMPITCLEFGRPLLAGLGTLAIVYGAFAALSQRRLILVLAYASLSHVGFIAVGMFSLHEIGLAGSMMQMINHGLTTSAMFLIYAILVSRHGELAIDHKYQGLASQSPRLATLLIFFTLAGTGLPGLNNFVGELLTMIGISHYSFFLTAIGATGGLLGAWYALKVVQHVMMGKASGEKSMTKSSPELSAAETGWLLTIAMICCLLGVRPMTIMPVFSRDAAAIAAVYRQLEDPHSVENAGESTTKDDNG